MMGDVLNRATGQYLKSVNTPDFDPEKWIINPDLKDVGGVDQKYWLIEGDAVRSMNSSEKIDNYLPAAITKKNLDLRAAVNEYITGHYDAIAKLSLLAAWIEGMEKKYPNRISLVESVWVWVQSCIDLYDEKSKEIAGVPSLDALDAITWDLTKLDASDPKVSFVTVKNTTD